MIHSQQINSSSFLLWGLSNAFSRGQYLYRKDGWDSTHPQAIGLAQNVYISITEDVLLRLFLTAKHRCDSWTLCVQDPFVLTIALDEAGHASGSLYLDDGQSHAHTHGQFSKIDFSFDKGVLTGKVTFAIHNTHIIRPDLSEFSNLLYQVPQMALPRTNWVSNVRITAWVQSSNLLCSIFFLPAWFVFYICLARKGPEMQIWHSLWWSVGLFLAKFAPLVPSFDLNGKGRYWHSSIKCFVSCRW